MENTFNRTPVMRKDTNVKNKTITLYEIIQENTFITQNALAIKGKNLTTQLHKNSGHSFAKDSTKRTIRQVREVT